MFKSIAEYDQGVLDVLIKIRDGNKWEEKPEGMNKEIFLDLLRHADKKGFICGLSFVKSHGGFYTGTPQLTRAGLELVESATSAKASEDTKASADTPKK